MATDYEMQFFTFIYKRQLIWHKRFVLKKNPPWTDDEILQKFKIINMYRELDRCTIYIVEKLRGKDRQTMLLNVIFYRFFNRSGLYEELGIEPFKIVTPQIKERLAKKFSALSQKGPIFNNAYLISSGTANQKKHISILNNLAALDVQKMVQDIDRAKRPEDAFDIFTTVPMAGPFLACEFWTDLAYLHFFKQRWTDDDFVNIGPGAKWGLEIMYGKLSKKELQEKLQHLHELQRTALPNIHKELGERLPWQEIAYKNACSNYPFLSITNIEGALCEFRKYTRLQKGLGKRRYFAPSDR